MNEKKKGKLAIVPQSVILFFSVIPGLNRKLLKYYYKYNSIKCYHLPS